MPNFNPAVGNSENLLDENQELLNEDEMNLLATPSFTYKMPGPSLYFGAPH